MKFNEKKWSLVVLFTFLTLLSMQMPVYGYAFGNGAGGSYIPLSGGCSEDGGSIEDYVIQGASQFLGAETAIKEILRMVELQDTMEFDYDVLNSKLENALVYMDEAIMAYDLLLAKAVVTPYNESFLAMLKGFDYDDFKSQWNLNGIIFDEVEDYLRKGRITEMLDYIRAQFLNIKAMLNRIKGTVEEKRLPELTEFWRLNETCAHLACFGSYCSRVFYANS